MDKYNILKFNIPNVSPNKFLSKYEMAMKLNFEILIETLLSNI